MHASIKIIIEVYFEFKLKKWLNVEQKSKFRLGSTQKKIKQEFLFSKAEDLMPRSNRGMATHD